MRGDLSKRLRDSLAGDYKPKSPLDEIFEEQPVDLTTFVRDKKFLANPPLSDVQFEAVRHIERIYYNDLYMQMGLEWTDDYWLEPVRMTNFITLQFGKGCLVGTEKVYNARNGRWECISQASPLVVQGVDAVTESGSTEHLPESPALDRGQSSVTAAAFGQPFKRGRGRCLRVTTTSGISAEVYEGHLFVSWESLPTFKNRYELAKPVWRHAGDLQKGDRIALVSKLDCLEPVPLDPREVELVGYWLGDGSMPVKGSSAWGFYVDPQCRELISRYVGLVESYAGITAKLEPMLSGVLRVRATGTTTEQFECAYPSGPHSPNQVGMKRGLCNRHYLHVLIKGQLEEWPKCRERLYPLVAVIRKHGLYGSRAWDKRVPEAFFSLPDDQLAIFLSALWNTDGTWYLKKGKRGKDNPCAEYTSTSEHLVRDVQRLLYRFGIVSRVTSGFKKYTYLGERRVGRQAWRVTISSGFYLQRLASVLRQHDQKEVIRQEFENWEWGRIQQVPKGDVYWDKVKSVEEIGVHDYWDMHVPESGTYVAGSGPLLSSNSGKDHVCRIASLRIAYLLLCLRFPQVYYGMPQQDTIHMLNVAASSSQAQQAFFNPMLRVVKNNWFADKCHPKPGYGLISWNKNVEMVSGHADAETQEGLNLILGIADEIDAFKSKEDLEKYRPNMAREPTRSAENVLKMLRTSGSTRFPEVYKTVRISYPRFLGSLIQRLTDQAHADNKKHGSKSRHYVSGPLATWEVNPRVSGPEVFADDYAEDPVMAKSMYECKPSRAVDTYFKNMDAVRACFTEDSMPISVDYVTKTLRSEVTGQHVVSWEPSYWFDPGFVPIEGARYAMHGDLAIRGDKAGVAMSHVTHYETVVGEGVDEEGGAVEMTFIKPVVKTDFVIAYAADVRVIPAREIQIRWARMLAFELIKRGFNVVSLSYDGFQSFDSMQILELHGITSERVSMDMSEDPWKNWRDLMYEGRHMMPFSSSLLEEIEALGRFGGKVDHPPGGQKDQADAVCGSVLGAITVGGEESDGGEQAYPGAEEFALGSFLQLPLNGESDEDGFDLPIGMAEIASRFTDYQF